MANKIDWDSINSKLPYKKSPEAKAKRKELFDSFDVNDNGYISLAEVDKGMRDVLNCDDLFNCKQAINASFHRTKNVSKAKDKYGPEYLQFCEFRVFLKTLRQYFEYYQAFDRIDTGDDNRISKEEFCAPGIKQVLNKWISEPIKDMDKEFRKIDTNHGGQILFGEFIVWALEKDLDIDDDVEPDE